MCFDRRGRLHTRRLSAGAIGVVIGFFFSFYMHNLLMTTPIKDFVPPSKEVSPVDPMSFDVHCFVAIPPGLVGKSVEEEILAISETWGKRCSSVSFSEGRSVTNNWQPWQKAIEKGVAMAKPTDWFVYTAFGTYVVIENVRKMVSLYAGGDTSSIVWAQEFDGSPASVLPPLVLSATALKRFHSSLKENKRCVLGRRPAVHTLASCLRAADFDVADSRDSQLKHRMLPYPARQLIRFSSFLRSDLEYSDMKYKPKSGVDCCSPDLVSVAHLYTPSLYFYDYMLYKTEK